MTRVVAAEHVLTGSTTLAPGAVRIDRDRITAVTTAVPEGEPLVAGYLVPGFIDVHCHGGGGASVAAGDADAVATTARTHLRHGTTTLCASLVSASPQRLLDAVASLADLVSDGLIAGIHLEGPWISPRYRGAHDPAALRLPAPSEIDRLLDAGRGTISMVTIAPELAGGVAAVRRLSAAGVRVAVGHTDATWDQTLDAIEAGATVATHLFNQMRPLHHRDPGPIPALVVDPRVHVELIADGVHVHPAVLAMVRAAVPPGRRLLITDAMAAAGSSDGDYLLGEMPVHVRDGVARLADGGVLAGSALTMDAAFRRAVRACGFTLEEAVQACSVVPARLLARTDIGAIEPGRRADLVALDENLHVRQVWHSGRPMT